MIRVREGDFPLSHILNGFHSKSPNVVDDLYAINVYGTTPPPSTDLGLYGVDIADPQPSSYPASTTFLLRTSVSKPLILNSSVGSCYFQINLIRDGGNLSFSIAFRRQYTGVVKRVWNAGELIKYPWDLNNFQPSPGTPYYLRFYDSFDPLDFFLVRRNNLDIPGALFAVPRTLGWVANQTYYPATNKKIILALIEGEGVSLSYGLPFTEFQTGLKWDGSPIDSLSAAAVYVIQTD